MSCESATDSIRCARALCRISYIQKIEFVPSVNVLIQTLVFAVVGLLLFLKSDGSYGTILIFGFVSYLFVFAMHPDRPGVRAATSP